MFCVGCIAYSSLRFFKQVCNDAFDVSTYRDLGILLNPSDDWVHNSLKYNDPQCTLTFTKLTNVPNPCPSIFVFPIKPYKPKLSVKTVKSTLKRKKSHHDTEDVSRSVIQIDKVNSTWNEHSSKLLKKLSSVNHFKVNLDSLKKYCISNDAQQESWCKIIERLSNHIKNNHIFVGKDRSIRRKTSLL
ncbi:hypothetical protein GJ496_000453 [Pomphorhynchus laevis]|nr:hypothetical protein GJ496_000453 [Pomphorhynchus laevis]